VSGKRGLRLLTALVVAASLGATGLRPVLTLAAPNGTTTSVAAGSSISAFGQPVTLTATVGFGSGGPAPSGTVQFYSDGTAVGNQIGYGPVAFVTSTVVSGGNSTTVGTATLTLRATQLAIGSHSIFAVYSGDANYSSSTSAGSGLTVTMPNVKLGVTREGIYRLTYNYLVNTQHVSGIAGAQLSTLGVVDGTTPVPAYIGTTDGSALGTTFQSNDYIEFYGHPVNTTYASMNVYELSDAIASPARAATQTAASASSPVTSGVRTFYDLVRDGQVGTGFWQTQPGAPAAVTDESWPSDGDPKWSITEANALFGNPGTATTSFTLGGEDTTSSSCALSFGVWARPFNATSTPTYNLGVQINAHTLTGSPFTWAGANTSDPAYSTQSATFPCSYLLDNNTNATPNQFSFTANVPTGSNGEFMSVISAHISYSENLCATANQLAWETNGAGSYSVAGFSGVTAPDVWRVTGSSATVITGLAATTPATGPCPSTTGASFADSFGSPATYFASTSQLTPDTVTVMDTSSAADITGGSPVSAQYLIIAPSAFIANDPATSKSYLQPLIDLHSAAYGVKVVNVGNIYDEFGAGQSVPDAIRQYISFAHDNLGTVYVLLVGGDTYDYHGYLRCSSSQGTSNFCSSTNPDDVSYIPSLYVQAQFGVVASDNLYAVPESAPTNAPDVAIGRMPAITTTTLQTMIAKTVNYAKSVASVTTATALRSLMSADWGKGSSAEPDFKLSAQQAETLLPSAYTKSEYFRDGTSTDDTALASKFKSDWTSQNPWLVSWVGHGNQFVWGGAPNMFDSTSAQNLSNTSPAVVTQFGCATSFYADPTYQNLSATLLFNSLTPSTVANPGSGAVVTLGSTGLDLATEQEEFAGGFMNGAANNVDPSPYNHGYFFGYLSAGNSIGLAQEYAKDDLLKEFPGSSAYQDVVNSYVVLGDPALTLPQQPTMAQVSKFTAKRASSTAVKFTWKVAANPEIAGFNVYAGSRRLNTSVIPVHTSRTYHFLATYHGKAPFMLHALLKNGTEIVTPATYA
jgi:hypothetical protein